MSSAAPALPPALPRTYLFVPADRPERIAKRVRAVPMW